MNFRNYLLVAVATCGLLAGVNFLYSKSVRLTCWPGGYAQNAWLAYCNAGNYGVYDVDAIWFQTEPEVASAITNAQVLTLSNSRLQAAFSLGGGGAWFAEHGYRAYFLGLPGAESAFGEMLWEKFKPRASVVIFDATAYFTGRMGYSEASTVADAPVRRAQALDLSRFQAFHSKFCRAVPRFCGHNFAYFRSRTDGHWIFPPSPHGMWIGAHSVPNDTARYATSSIPEDESPPYESYVKPAEEMLAKLGLPRHCVVITQVPSEEINSGLARYLAERLGVTLIDPALPGMTTFDRAHLSPQSARAWTASFVEQLGPTLQSCLHKE